MNYFELYKIPVSFLPDEKYIRDRYLSLSRQFHPDFYATASPEKQVEILNLSTENNKAFNILSDFDRRMKYILRETGHLEEEEKFTLPQMFLMEMMDLNELLMEIQFDPDPVKLGEVTSRLDVADSHLLAEIMPVLEQFDASTATPAFYHRVKEFYYKRRYLLRIRQQLDKFATP